MPGVVGSTWGVAQLSLPQLCTIVVFYVKHIMFVVLGEAKAYPSFLCVRSLYQ